MPVNETISYDTASKSLNVNGSYGFQLTITSTLDITISEIQLNPLILEVEIAGPGFPLGGATVNYHLYSVFGVDVDGFPLFNFNSGSVLADETGVALLDFSSDPQVDGSKAYTVIVDVHLGGLSGVGYKARERVTSAGNIIPFLDSLPSTEGGNATVLLAHKWGKNEPDENMGALHFNATFFSLSDDYEPITVKIENSTGTVNSGGGKPYHPVQIPTSRMGFLIVTYRKGNEYGMTVMAWGLSALGFQIVFGGDPSGQLWAATDIRQVTVTGTAYQAKIACWSLKGYQIWSSR